MDKTSGSRAFEAPVGAAQSALLMGLSGVSDTEHALQPISPASTGGIWRAIGSPLGSKSGAAAKSDADSSARAALAGHVLVCDDETRLGDLTAGLLEECGFAAGFVPSALDAMAYLDAHSDTRVVLLDVNLSGGKSAQDLLTFLMSRPERLRVVLTSGSAKQEVRVELTQHPLVVGYLEKPYAEEDLTAAIADALALK